MTVVVRDKRGIEPMNDVHWFEGFGDPSSLGLAAGVGSLYTQLDSSPPGDIWTKTDAGDTAWTAQLTLPATGAGSGGALPQGEYDALDNAVQNLTADGSTDIGADLDTLTAAVVAAGGGTIVFPRGEYRVKTNRTLPADVTYRFVRGAILKIDDEIVVTILGEVEAGNHQIFGVAPTYTYGTGRVRFTPSATQGTTSVTRVVNPWWWGAVGDWNGSTGTDSTNAIQRCVEAVVGYPEMYVGRATSATSTTITKTGVGWVDDEFHNVTSPNDQWAQVRIIDGTGKGQIRTITDNTTDTITVGIAWDTTPDSTSAFEVTHANKTPRFLDCAIYAPGRFKITQPIRVESCVGFTLFGSGIGTSSLVASGGTTGTVASATSTTLTVSGTPWVANAYRNMVLRMRSGADADKAYRIQSNTTNTITLAYAKTFATTPSAGDEFEIAMESILDLNGVFNLDVSRLTLDCGSGTQVLHGLYYHRDAAVTFRGSSSAWIHQIDVTGRWINAALQFGSRYTTVEPNVNEKNWQEDIVSLAQVRVRGNRANDADAYIRGISVGTTVQANPLCYDLKQVDIAGCDTNLFVSQTNCALDGVILQTAISQDIFLNLGLQHYFSAKNIRTEATACFLRTNDVYAVPFNVSLENIGVQAEEIALSADGTYDVIDMQMAGWLGIKGLRVTNPPELEGASDVASATSTTLTKTSAGWTSNEFQNIAVVTITAGTGANQQRVITSNTTDTLTVSPAWDTTPDSTSDFVISALVQIRTGQRPLVVSLEGASLPAPLASCIAWDASNNAFVHVQAGYHEIDANNSQILNTTYERVTLVKHSGESTVTTELERNQVRTVTTTYTARHTDNLVLGNATSGAFTITLPTAAQATGRRITFKKTDASGNAVTLDGSGSETIDGAATLALAAQYDFATLLSDGAAWHVIAS